MGPWSFDSTAGAKESFMPKVRIIKGVAAAPWNIAAFVDDVIEVDEKQAAMLVQADRARYVTDENLHDELIEIATNKAKTETATVKPKRKK